ncbi:UDP-N-acetylmuramoyl-L-alanine--D-glutamate ligase [Qipengyuania spongiae]|uniref:UDP-N-acetylmuramoylalanine--D-glutamate ligase n=1 Tax=Qipengyuania spongiae TaxID=2909673 RepID=A0ABY5T114_9SPHN|nr:UDP-N-acetylmuramoyl-L-alanine--D-glutamate ligase [Qipengyuania spongiae]UVI40485.1 UDP-N-acetylmuramoyl-L-alanine--D-glutamate ligase [Qipengyuania spongiae]
MIVSPAWKGQRFAVLGLARSGRATVEALLAAGAEVLAWDAKPEACEAFAGRAALADPLEADLTGYAGVVVSPGVPLNTHPIKPHADSFGVPVIGDIELFAQAREYLPPHKVVGITGTNGKSTTTALVHHILKSAGVPTTMGGNIGLPILGQEPLPEGGVYVLELSSYQIDLTSSLDCDVAVLLNVTPDHLDRYESFEAYAASKARLFEMQSPKQFAVVDYRAEADEDVLESAEDPLIQFIDDIPPGDQSGWPTLQGPHNLQNAAAASAVCQHLGLTADQIARALHTYPGLPHRMERVAEISGVAYVNDSKGTNTAASAPALAAFDNVHWIVGGLAKEPGLGECEAHLGHVKAAYTIGQSGEDFARLLESRVPTKRAVTLEQAIASAANSAIPGDTVLLSPACASFDQFRDFEHRGEVFRKAVKELAA